MDYIQEPGILLSHFLYLIFILEFREAITLEEYECLTCLALMYEDDRTCCGNGKCFFPPHLKLPAELHELFFGNSAEAKEFRKKILLYNTIFSFASMQCHKIAAAPHGLPVLLINLFLI